jgi:hypothetical protein
MKEQTNGERFEEFMNSVQYPELEGTNALCDDIIKSREISDEEIDNYIDKNFIFNDEGNWQKKYFKAGAVWYREQLKKK